MTDKISAFKKANDTRPMSAIGWQSVLSRIKSDRYKQAIVRAREILALDGIDAYREYKKKLPAVTFAAKFTGNRDKKHVEAATGFLVPDIDHVKNVDQIFNLLKNDGYVWWVFRSPSNNGLKCGLRAYNIETDDDIKKFYYAAERYFSDVYGIKIDQACKDIARLTFVSWDPELWINPNPAYFDIAKWTKQDMPAPPAPPPIESRDNGWKGKYGAKVLESCCQEIRQAVKGEKHHTRLKRARLIGGFIASGFIGEDEALMAFERALKDSGTKDIYNAMKTVKDGISYGLTKPLEPEKQPIPSNNKDIPYYLGPDETIRNESCQQSQQSQHCPSLSADVSRCQQMSADGSKIHLKNEEKIDPKTPHNLTAVIREWIENSTGCFTVDQIDREFCLTTRTEKNCRSKILSRYTDIKLIKKDKRAKGKYWVIDSKIDWIDLDAVSEDPFPIRLPFKLHEHVRIPKKGIIVCAGTSNAGKTALVLNTLLLNLEQPYKKMYLMSEMGAGEFKSRVSCFDRPISDWKQVMAASKSYDFDGAIQHYNENGLTVIDYLEEVDGEYFKIASSIRDIYDSLENGVCFINIQKKGGSEFGRGGEATKEKARLYMTLDFLAARERSIVCALKITKLKEFKGKNLQGHELHFELTEGAIITPLMDWTPAYRVNRNACMAQYEKGDYVQPEYDGFIFRTVEGENVRINADQVLRWQDKMQNIDVAGELKSIASSSLRKPFLTKKGYFFALANILAKKDESRVQQIDNGTPF